jgi:hypothetical protein
VPSVLPDLDVVYFDRRHLSSEHDEKFPLALLRREPQFPWEVTNQAAVHLWFETTFGHAVDPIESIEEAIASWPETATSVGIRLENDQLRIIAPLGLSDLFGMVVRRNPRRASVKTYQERIRTKKYAERWPKVRILPV